MKRTFNYRETYARTIRVRLSEDERVRAGDIARGAIVKSALDDLESQLAPEDREKVTVIIEFIDKDLNVIIDLQGPEELIARIRDSVTPTLDLEPLYDEKTDRRFLRIPLALLTCAPLL